MGDRFIGSRISFDVDLANHVLTKTIGAQNSISATLDASLFNSRAGNGRVLTILPYRAPKQRAEPSNVQTFADLVSYRVLRARGFPDNFYLNCLDCDGKDLVAASSEEGEYIHNIRTAKSFKVLGGDEYDATLSISFSIGGSKLTIGKAFGNLLLYDVETSQCRGAVIAPGDGVNSIAWKDDKVVVVGTTTGRIITGDIRARTLCGEIDAHVDRVCGLRWNCNKTLLASGSNDNIVGVWDPRHREPFGLMSKHEAATRALCWDKTSPQILASGGGSADMMIYVHSVDTMLEVSKWRTGSQVSSLHWLDKTHIVASHGFTDHALKIWDSKKRTCCSKGMGHTGRVLSCVLGTEGKTLISASADETLRFWNLSEFKYPVTTRKAQPSKLTMPTIR